MIDKSSINFLIESFLKKGGKIDRYYLREVNRGKRSLVYFNGWFSGQNIRAAIMKSLGKV
ncbi:MAG: hypothetical protein UV64_C0029G0011 [Parcubacteria group bacterium GW2011_GWC1_43_11b]|nr:MAG: hypothetical protein UV64_C0029G0011 [Parcubacteria group bacterium GW2011_GWC1_43_11b]